MKKMRTAAKVGIVAGVSIIAVVLLLIISYYTWVNEQEVQQEENIKKSINEQVENLQTKYRQDFSEEIREYPSYRVISEVLGEPSVKEKYRQYLEALNYRSESEADNMYENFKNYLKTRAETKFGQDYPLESFAGDLGELIFGK